MIVKGRLAHIDRPTAYIRVATARGDRLLGVDRATLAQLTGKVGRQIALQVRPDGLAVLAPP